jgi:hypothetical protein
LRQVTTRDPPASIELDTYTRSERRAARIVAALADAVQLGLFPLFGEGFASPANDILDVIVAAVLIKLLGFHWALLPAAGAELVPVLDLAPTWTAAVLMITGGRRLRFAALAVLVAVAAVILVLVWRR